MTPDHQIRLRGPWQLSLLSPSEAGRLEALGRFEAPNGLADRLPPEFRGRVRLERSFHRPTGLEDESRVQLRIATDLQGHLSLNDQPLGTVVPGENLFDATPHLQIRNRICIEVVIDASCPMRQPSCDARLEIYA